ncbi:hypothetical protein SDC9_172561 [bioreactor metagenome]|uniref:Uncharacterized protein n=1 Tax=bioreactor metagenome TaxID=1076179 RepID=A0A645GMI4_9ZZZZ
MQPQIGQQRRGHDGHAEHGYQRCHVDLARRPQQHGQPDKQIKCSAAADQPAVPCGGRHVGGAH